MATREILSDGSVRLRGERSAFVYTRLRPAVLLLTIYGQDSGDLGSAPLDEVLAEHRRFLQPLELFVDTTETTHAAATVSDAWTGWLDTHRGRLRQVHILAGSRSIHLTVAVAQHLSRTERLVQIHRERPPFIAALTRAAPAFADLPPGSRAAEPAGMTGRTVDPGGAVTLAADGCRFVFRDQGNGALIVTVSGEDRGQLGTAALDELVARLERGKALELFVDASEVTGVATRVSDDWTAFFSAHARSLKQVHVYSGAKPVHLTLGIAKHFSYTGELMRIYTDGAEFQAAVSRATRAR